MSKIDDLRKLIDGLKEDHREEGESLEDAYNSRKEDIDKYLNDIAEDHREEGEQIQKLTEELELRTKERDELMNSFISGKEKEKEKNLYEDIK